jgi:hypothetical protein
LVSASSGASLGDNLSAGWVAASAATRYAGTDPCGWLQPLEAGGASWDAGRRPSSPPGSFRTSLRRTRGGSPAFPPRSCRRHSRRVCYVPIVVDVGYAIGRAGPRLGMPSPREWRLSIVLAAALVRRSTQCCARETAEAATARDLFVDPLLSPGPSVLCRPRSARWLRDVVDVLRGERNGCRANPTVDLFGSPRADDGAGHSGRAVSCDGDRGHRRIVTSCDRAERVAAAIPAQSRLLEFRRAPPPIIVGERRHGRQ